MFQGVTFKSLTFPGVKVSQLYIKLDKKLIVDIEAITISKQSNVKSSFDDIKKDLQKLPVYLNYFQSIHIESLKIDGNEFVIDVDDEIVYIDNKFINIAARPKFGKSKVSLDLYSLYLKDFDTLLEGNIYVDYLHDKTTFKGAYSRQKVNGNLQIDANDRFLDFKLDSDDVENIHFVKDFVSLHPVIEKWMYDNVLGTYKLKNFSGRVSTRNFQPLLSSFKGTATVTDAKVRFHDDVDYVKTDLLTAQFENDNLSFSLLKPKYKDIDIEGSNVVIHNITGTGSNIDVNLFSKHKVSQDVLDIISAYGVDLPVLQLDGNTDSKLIINVDFTTSKVSVDGEFKTKKANFRLSELDFLAQDTTVELHDNMVYIHDAQINYKDMLDTKLNLQINASESHATGDLSIKSFTVKTPTKSILDIKNKKSTISVDFSKNIKIGLPELFSFLEITQDSFDIKVNDLSKLYDDSVLLQELKVTAGWAQLSIFDFDALDIYLKAEVRDVDLPLKRDGRYILDLDIEGQIKEDSVDIHTLDNNISVHYDENLISISIKDTDVVFDTNNNNMNQFEQNLTLKVQNSNIDIVDAYSFDAKTFAIHKNPQGVFFEGEVVNLDLALLKKGKKIEELTLSGQYIDKILTLNSADKNLSLRVDEKDNLFIDLKNYDVIYDTTDEEKLTNKNIRITAKNSNIIINKQYKLLSNNFELETLNNKTTLNSSYKKSSIRLVNTSNNYKIINGNNLPDEFINSLLNKKLISGGNITFIANGKGNTVDGQIKFKDNKVENLAFINNLILLINTSPALLNPLLVIPAVVDIAANKGVSVDGYKINKGEVDFTYNFDTEIFYAKKLKTKGSIVDFEGQATLDFKNSTVNSTVDVAFMKAYTNIVKHIPLVNYIFLGKDKKVSTKVDIRGSLDDPKYETHLGKEGVKVPLDMIKRIFKLPGELLK